MKKIFLITTVIGLLLTACGNHDKKQANDDVNGYEKAKESVEEKEKKNPLKFLAVTSRDKHNLIGQTVIKVNVINNAKVCTYKDVELEYTFFSKTGVLLQKEKETVFELIAPGESVDYKSKVFAAKGTDSIAVKVLTAKTK